MTTKCVNCGKTFGQHYAMRCESGSDESIWEPSTEGTQAAQPERESTCEMIDLFTGETMGYIHSKVPAPVAQVDAGKCELCGTSRESHYDGSQCPRGLGLYAVGYTFTPAVAQTELNIPDELKGDWAEAVLALGKPWHWMQITPSRVIGWIERIAQSEAREAELQARREALERSHAKLLEAVNEALGCIDPGVYPDTVLELQEVKSAAEKL